jgi:hypothetical protein
MAVCLVGIIGGRGASVTAAPAVPAGAAACEVTEAPGRPDAPRQEVAASRTGKIAGLGTISASIGWDGRKALSLADRDFTVTRTFRPATREVEITITGKGERPLVIRAGGAGGLRVSSGDRAVEVSDTAVTAGALRGRAVAAFRERIGNFERQLIAGKAARVDDPHADGFLFVGAFLASLAGDPTAVGRARDLVLQRIRGKLQAVRFDFKDCVTEYELYLLEIDKQRTQCLEAANGRDSWYARAADRLGCEAEFIAQALAGEGQFVACTALGSILA